MLLDIVTQDMYETYNVKVANALGLKEAVYCNILINIFYKATKKQTLDRGYIVLDRNYIFQRTTLQIDEQTKIDRKLSKYGIVTISTVDVSKIKFNLDLYTSLLGCEDLTEKLNSILAEKKTAKTSKPQAIAATLKKSDVVASISNSELRNAYDIWIDEICTKFGYMTKSNIQSFQTELNNFTKGDLDAALSVLKIAANLGYREASWAINVYQKQYTSSNTSTNAPRTTRQIRTTQMSNEVF